MKAIRVQIINKSAYPLPEYQTALAAGMDVRANIGEAITLAPMERKVIPTGLFAAIPEGYEIQVRPRSGLAAKRGLTVLNAPGTIDADYRGEIGVILSNVSSESQTVEPGERIAQLVLARHERIEWETVDTLPETERGEGGFGSTGTGCTKNCSHPAVFEFCPKTSKDQSINVNCFHINHIRENGEPESELFVNNFQPLLIFDSDIVTTTRFKKMRDVLYNIGDSEISADEKLRRMYIVIRELEDSELKKKHAYIQKSIDANKEKYK